MSEDALISHAFNSIFLLPGFAFNHLGLAMLSYGHFSPHLEFIYTAYVVCRSRILVRAS